MRVLWLVRKNLTQHPGGDTTQILSTADAVRKRGHTIELASGRARIGDFDAVHLFHLDRLWENASHCRRIRAAGRPAVLSPIYWPADEYDRQARAGMQGILARTFGSNVYRNLRLMQRSVLGCVTEPDPRNWTRTVWSFRRSAEFVLRSVSVLLPNSNAEQRIIEEAFGIHRPTVVVPNAVTGQFSPPAEPWPEKRDGVLCVGRIEPRKNQLALIRALRGADITLRLVGQAGRFSGKYFRQCQHEAGANVQFLGQRHPGELQALYRTALVHACVSWYETPGLASLEAAACGCAIVVTPGGCTGEYFSEDAYYCRPDDADSIRQAVEKAIAAGPAQRLVRRVADAYTWDAAAEKTVQAYQLATGSTA